jgi:hypothetical protein
LANGNLAMVSWYLLERACFSVISAASRSARMLGGSSRRLMSGGHHLVVSGAHAVKLELDHQLEDVGALHQPIRRNRS